MKSIFSAALALLIAGPAFAQSFTVQKVKGKKAIIVINSGSLYEGQSASVDGGGSSSFGETKSASAGKRDNYLGLSGSFTSGKPSGSTSQITKITTTVLYGWNLRSYEYGVQGILGMASGSGSSVTSIGVGGQYDYNFSENRPGVNSLMAVGISGAYVMNSGSGSSSDMSLFPNVSYRWFALGNATAIRVAAGLAMATTSANGKSTSDTGLAVSLGLMNYF